jgi:hypothetical protein
MLRKKVYSDILLHFGVTSCLAPIALCLLPGTSEASSSSVAHRKTLSVNVA